MSGKHILLLGAGGQLGRELKRTLSPVGTMVAFDRSRLDVTDHARVRSTLRDLRPAVIVNAAAYTQVDRAEEEPERARAVNAEALDPLAREAARLGALLVHFSTDYVFDGRKGAPYTEGDEPNPLNVYGETKLAGEEAIRGAGGEHLILRTAWLYGLSGNNFLCTILRLAGERDELRVVDDQTGSPTWHRWLAATVAGVIAADPAITGDGGGAARGTYHVAGGGSTTWCGLARAALARAADPAARRCRVVAIPTSEYPTPARRPACSALDSGRLERNLAIDIEPWEEQLERCIVTRRAARLNGVEAGQ